MAAVAYTDRGSGTPVTTGTTWASATSAVDGTPPANPATYATLTSIVSGAVATIEISGYDFSTALPASGTAVGEVDVLTNIVVSPRHFENNTGRFASIVVTVWDGATQIGGAFACTLAAAARNDNFTYTPTLAQLKSSTFKVRVTITGAASTQSRIASLDHVDVTANYVTVAPKATTFSEAFTSLSGSVWTTVAGTPTIVAGALQLDHAIGTPTTGGEVVMTIADYDLSDSNFFAKLTSGGAPVGAAVRRAGVLAWVDVNNYLGVNIVRSSSLYQMQWLHNDAGSGGNSTVTYDPAIHVYARVRLSGTSVFYGYSADGTSWTDFPSFTVTAGLITKLKHSVFRCFASEDVTDTTDPQVASFDAINIAVAAGGRPKVYLAGAFTKKPLKVWTGTAWVEKPVKVWTGSAWKTLT